ncbi:hypothetical protein Lser_V15G11078 [Lactuca serriola]
MATTGKIVREVEVKSHRHQVHGIYKNNHSDLAAIAPDKVEACHLVSGQWDAPGSVIQWNFYHDGKVETAKVIIVEVDDESHKIVYKVIEGPVLEFYNPVILTFSTEDKGDKKLVIWTMEFEKVNASLPDPTHYLDLLCAVVEDVDGHLFK